MTTGKTRVEFKKAGRRRSVEARDGEPDASVVRVRVCDIHDVAEGFSIRESGTDGRDRELVCDCGAGNRSAVPPSTGAV